MMVIQGKITTTLGVVYVLAEKIGKDGKTYWYMSKAGTDKRYSIHHRACGECGAEVLVCNCNSFFWKGECKHIRMFNEIRAKVVAAE
ncbi:MAG: hypothetical protein KAY24_11965 [Candidatus Eisenbacteria sp.]|nr:hypothetical protein [Candidatus Eisenbacteria bacterium]